jgi:hypothetical protein
MIPLLPCRSIDDQIDFYESLGFEVTYRQTAPNVYAAVQRGAIELHFFCGSRLPDATTRWDRFSVGSAPIRASRRIPHP